MAKKAKQFLYTVKIMNHNKKSEYTVRKLQEKDVYSDVETLKTDICKQFSDEFPEGEIELGFIQPGHSFKGKQKWLCSNECLKEMYEEYNGRKEIILWCYAKVSKTNSRKRSGESPPSTGKSTKVSKGYASQQEKMIKAQETVDELRKKHGGKYSEEKLHTWANLIQMKKHSSLEEPPDYPFFRGYKKAEAGKSGKDPSNSNATHISPVKRLSIRTTLIEQLEKCTGILEKGGLSQAEYTELQQCILKDIRDTH